MLLMAVCGSAWGLGWTVSMADYESTSFTTTDGRFTITADKAGGSTAPTYYAKGKELRVYAKGTVTIKCNQGTLNSLYFNLTQQGLNRLAAITASVGTVGELVVGSNTVEWTAPEGTAVSEVTFTVGEKAVYGMDGSDKAGQLCFNQVFIDMTEGEVAPTPVARPTFSPEPGEVESGTEVTITAAAGCVVYYTLDGSSALENGVAPNNSNVETVTITEDVTIKAVAMDITNVSSEEAVASYTVKAAEEPITEEPDYSFDFNSMQNVPTSNSSDAGDITENLSIEEDGVTMTISPSTGSNPNRWWSTANGPQLRMYSGTLTFTSQQNITKIEIYNGKWNDGNSVDNGEIANSSGVATWTGSSKSVTLTIAGNTQMNKVVVTTGDEPIVVTVPVPTFSPEAGEVEEGTVVTISSSSAAAAYEVYYTLDGSSPVNNKSALGGNTTETVTINEDVTIKAICMDDEGNASDVVEAAYTVKASVEPGGDNATAMFDATKDLASTGTSAAAWSITKDGITIACTSGIGGNGTEYRIYKNQTFTVSSQVGNITKIEFTDVSSNPVSGFGTVAGLSGTTWTGNAESVTFTASEKQVRLTLINVYYTPTGEQPVEVSNPVISPEGGNFFEATEVTITSDQEDAIIYYTLDGSTPTENSTVYTGPFMVEENTTVKAIAYLEDFHSVVVEQTYTFPTVCNNIAAFRQLEENETAVLFLNGAEVLAVDGSSVYIRDAGADKASAIIIYNAFGADVTAGTLVTGQLTGKFVYFGTNRIPELTNATDMEISTEAGLPAPKTMVDDYKITANTVYDYVCDFIEIKGEVSIQGNNVYIGEVQLYVRNNIAAANELYGGNIKSGDHVTDLVEDGDYVVANGILTIYNGVPELYLLNVKKATPVEYTFNDYGIGTLYYSNLRFNELPEGVTASIITGIDGKTLQEQTLYNNNQTSFIPSGNGVILRGEPGSTVTLLGEECEYEGTYGGNLLSGTDEVYNDATTRYYFYVLSAKEGKVGFYYFSKDGHTIQNQPHRAYLQLTEEEAALAPAFFFAGTTGIAAVEGDTLDANAPMYNIAGQRVSGSYKGVVIQNGVKRVK